MNVIKLIFKSLKLFFSMVGEKFICESVFLCVFRLSYWCFINEVICVIEEEKEEES